MKEIKANLKHCEYDLLSDYQRGVLDCLEAIYEDEHGCIGELSQMGKALYLHDELNSQRVKHERD